MTQTSSDTYEYLIESFTEELITKRLCFWYDQTAYIIDRLGLKDKVIICDELLISMIIDLFADLDRLKHFHNITKVNRLKSFSYAAYWFMRRSPVQWIIKEPCEDLLYINQRIAACIITTKFFLDYDIDESRINDYLRKIEYFFKYRQYNPHNIELMLESFLIGANQDIE